MLSVRDLTKEQLESFIDATNKHLPKKSISTSLINGGRNMVVTGPPQSLYGLNLTLRKAKAPSGLNQSRTPHSQRKLRITNKFLPITCPFHSHLLTGTTNNIIRELKAANITFDTKNMTIPVYDTYDGSDLRKQKDIATRVVDLITIWPVHWETATNFHSTHIIDFGPGGVSGLGPLTHKNKEGTVSVSSLPVFGRCPPYR